MNGSGYIGVDGAVCLVTLCKFEIGLIGASISMKFLVWTFFICNGKV